MTGNRTIKEKDTEKKRGKKRFIERLAEEQEADNLIEDFLNEDSTDEGGTHRQDGNGSFSS